METLDLNFVRSCFYAFDESNPLKDRSFFENAGGSFPSKFVVDKLTEFYGKTKVQPYGEFNESIEAGNAMDISYKKIAKMLGVEENNLHFGPSTSQNTYVLSNALRQAKVDRKTIIVSNQDHESNTGVWRNLGNVDFEIKEWKMRDNGKLYIEDLKEVLDEDVLLLAFPHVSNIIGEINPVKEICSLAKNVGAFTCVDGVSYAPHGIPLIKDFRPDIYLFSSYKTFGPHLGVMYVSSDFSQVLESQCHYFNRSYNNKRFTPAGPDHAQIAALGGVADYYEAFAKHHFDEKSLNQETIDKINQFITQHEHRLLEPLLDFLDQKNSLRVIGSTKTINRVPTVAIKTEKSNIELAKKLNDLDVLVGTGDFYAVRLLEALNIDTVEGVMRISFVHYTSKNDIDKLVKALDSVI